jgi:hypothetical protein
MLVELTKAGGIMPLLPVESNVRTEPEMDTSAVLIVVVVVVVEFTAGPGALDGGGMSP